MFGSGRSVLFTFFNVLALFSALALAAPLRGSDAYNVTIPASVALEKRGGDRFTYYDAGQNACGSYDSNSAWVIALSPEMYANGAHCYKSVTIQYNGKQVKATITDECPGCSGKQADLSRPLFAHLAPLDQGVIYGDWWLN